MVSEVDICNAALGKLGAARITSLRDETKGARAMHDRYARLRDLEQEMSRWRFCVYRTTLEAHPTPPPWGYALRYTRPADDLRPLMIGRIDAGAYAAQTDQPLFDAFGEFIETDQPAPLEYEYIRRVRDTSMFPRAFVETLACRLAADAAEELTQAKEKEDRLKRDHERALSEARRLNALYRPPQPRHVRGRWWSARVAGDSGGW